MPHCALAEPKTLEKAEKKKKKRKTQSGSCASTLSPLCSLSWVMPSFLLIWSISFSFFFLKARPYLCVALNRVGGVVEGRIVSSLDAAHLKGKGERYKD